MSTKRPADAFAFLMGNDCPLAVKQGNHPLFSNTGFIQEISQYTQIDKGDHSTVKGVYLIQNRVGNGNGLVPSGRVNRLETR